MATLTATETDDLDVARSVLATEAAGLRALAASLDGSFNRAVELLAGVSGRIVVSGMGKSGHVAHKIAATLASTGTPALFFENMSRADQPCARQSRVPQSSSSDL